MGTTATGQSDAGAGTPPAGGGAAGAGSGSGTASGAGTAKPPAGGGGNGEAFNREELDPLLRGMNASEMNMLFQQLVAAARQPVASTPPAEPTPKPTAIDPKVALDPNSEGFNPEGAFDAFVRKNYGGLLGEISNRSMEGLYVSLRNELPDFQKHEAQIRELLSKRDPTTLRREDVIGAYYGVMGYAASEELKKSRRTTPGTTTVPPTARHDEPSEEPLSETDKMMAHRFFGDKVDPIAAFKEARKRAEEGDGFEMKVPIGGGVRE